MSKDRCVLVVGGGVAGLTVATALADRGLRTILVERSTELGGHAAAWACMATDECARCSACMVEDLIRNALDHTGLEIITNARLDGFSGAAGAYELSVSPYGTAAVACGQQGDGPGDGQRAQGRQRGPLLRGRNGNRRARRRYSPETRGAGLRRVLRGKAPLGEGVQVRGNPAGDKGPHHLERA